MAGYEHALFLILLLGWLLRDLHGNNQVSLYLIAGGLLLALMPPFISVQIPWNLFLALVLPWIFWQNARSWLRIERHLMRREVYLWLITALCLVLVMVFVGNQPWIKSIFFGIVASSMLWQASSREGFSNPLGNVGPLALVFLLIETSLALEAPRYFTGSLFSGAGVGIALALLSIAAVKKAPPKYESWISLGQVYLAYGSALVIGASAIVAALANVVAFAEFHQRRLDINGSIKGAALSNDRLTFFIALGIFIFTAWQTHQPVTLILLLEAGFGMCIGLLIAFLGRRMGLPRFVQLSSIWRSLLQFGLILLGMFLLWPRGPEMGPIIIWIALGSAVFLPVLLAILLAALHDLKMRWDENPRNGF